ncbi:hypothetical protein MTR_8g479300 [Medicago truncatula]|uniref:Uncharacterized protein n=1 Tax=Medicago truncatula TaxID=3880 RepID=A0A072TSL3_MEDTR|nr:hypothetical protein MTR_8g479300 [Medicago truncatula]
MATPGDDVSAISSTINKEIIQQQDSLAEWSKAPDLGSGPKGRGWHLGWVEGILSHHGKAIKDHTAKRRPLLPMLKPLAKPCFNPNFTYPSKALEKAAMVLLSPAKE